MNDSLCPLLNICFSSSVGFSGATQLATLPEEQKGEGGAGEMGEGGAKGEGGGSALNPPCWEVPSLMNAKKPSSRRGGRIRGRMGKERE